MTAAETVERVAACAELDATALRRLLANAYLFTSTDRQAGPPISAVRLECDGKTLTAVATDRYTLSFESEPLHNQSSPFETLIDRADVAEMVKLLKTQATPVSAHLSVREDEITVRLPALSITRPTLDGQFFDYRRHIPDEADQTAVDGIAFNPALLARFAKVEPDHGDRVPARFMFTGSTTAAHVRIGTAFQALIMPVRA